MKVNLKDWNQHDKVKDLKVPLLMIRIPKDESN